MTDIIVTTPKHQMKNAAKEAEDIAVNEGGFYFRELSSHPKLTKPGDRIFYVEDGYIRGYCIIRSIDTAATAKICASTKIMYYGDVRVYMDATTWTWIEKIPMRGFQGWRYSTLSESDIHIVGNWKDPRPEL